MQIGIIGLGIMGRAYATNLRQAGFDVAGCDPVAAARGTVADTGAEVYETTGPWLADCPVVIVSVAKPDVLHKIGAELAGLLASGQTVVETGTFALSDKMAFRDTLEPHGIAVLDCPVSGTGAQAAVGDLLMMASGDPAALDKCRPALGAITKGIIYAGPFGAGSKMKYVANHAVVVHNCAAAEVLGYARSLGLDDGMVYDMLSTGAGASKMLELRMPLMIDKSYRPPTASLEMFAKDIGIIGRDMMRTGAHTPLFSACHTLYDAACNDLPPDYDAAAVFEVFPEAEPDDQ